MLLNDRQIHRLATKKGMITPYEPELIRRVGEYKMVSYGQSSYGYDLRLSPKEFRVFRHIPGTIVNPKAFNPDNLELAQLQTDEFGCYFILPAHSYGLGVAYEKLDLPPDVTAIFLGKSTYARCGLIANLTAGGASWEGHLTLEISNSSHADARIYASEGIVQALFLQGKRCKTSYANRLGKYQGQPHEVILARV